MTRIPTQPTPPDYDLADLLRKSMTKGSPKFYVVTASDLEVIECSSEDELIDKVKECREKERKLPCGTRVFLATGARIHISKGEFKYILFPDGKKAPLFVATEELEADEEGYLVLPREPGSFEEAADEESTQDDFTADDGDYTYGSDS